MLVGTENWRGGAVDLENPEEGRLASERGRQGSSVGDLGKKHAVLTGLGEEGTSAGTSFGSMSEATGPGCWSHCVCAQAGSREEMGWE